MSWEDLWKNQIHLLILRSPKGGCCSISDNLSCSNILITYIVYWSVIFYALGMEFGESSFCPVWLWLCLSLCGKKTLTLAKTFESYTIERLYFGMYTKIIKPFQMAPRSVTLWPIQNDIWPPFLKPLTLTINFEPLKLELSYFTYTFLVMRPFWSCQQFWPSDLDDDICPTYLKKNFNLGRDFWTVRDRDIIFIIKAQFTKPFQMKPRLFTLIPSSWPLTYIKKNLIFAITFELLEVELSYFRCTFLVIKSFQSGCDLVTLNVNFDLHTTSYTLTLAITFEG